MSEVDRIPVKNLWDKYSVGKTKFYEILDQLKIERVKVGNQAFIGTEGQERLEKYFSVPEELRERFVRELSERLEQVGELTANHPELIPAKYTPEVIGNWIEQFTNAIRPSDQFSRYEQLERFARNGWLIQSRELKRSIGLKSIRHEMRWGGFKLTRVRGRWWRITKE